jgi:hypothetical protein
MSRAGWFRLAIVAIVVATGVALALPVSGGRSGCGAAIAEAFRDRGDESGTGVRSLLLTQDRGAACEQPAQRRVYVTAVLAVGATALVGGIYVATRGGRPSS